MGRWFNRCFLFHRLLGHPPLSQAEGVCGQGALEAVALRCATGAYSDWGKVSTCLILSLLLSGLTVLMFISSGVAAVSFPYPPMSLARREQALQCSA